MIKKSLLFLLVMYEYQENRFVKFIIFLAQLNLYFLFISFYYVKKYFTRIIYKFIKFVK